MSVEANYMMSIHMYIYYANYEKHKYPKQPVIL